MLMLVYSAGLRVGEVVKLRVEDIDSKRKLIYIRSAKGKKDRYTLLSEFMIEQLRTYYKEYRPKEFLFEGAEGRKHISEQSVQHVFERAVQAAGIRKHVTVHSLRHAFETHLLEAGTDLRYIQALLRHQSVRTTEVYTHVSTKSIGQVRSPLDFLLRKDEHVLPPYTQKLLKTRQKMIKLKKVNTVYPARNAGQYCVFTDVMHHCVALSAK
ncbi:MAG: tyrosine-type recombinase/integrase [Bacteroidota bacterium]|nr:tyrosine-type recombinase/integrase [Bacteroidota bacterium]